MGLPCGYLYTCKSETGAHDASEIYLTFQRECQCQDVHDDLPLVKVVVVAVQFIEGFPYWIKFGEFNI